MGNPPHRWGPDGFGSANSPPYALMAAGFASGKRSTEMSASGSIDGGTMSCKSGNRLKAARQPRTRPMVMPHRTH
jgi:hypothetical protein